MMEWFSDAFVRFLNQGVAFAPRVPISLLIFFLFWLAALGAEKFAVKLGTSRDIDASLVRFLGRAAKTTIVIFGIVTALGTLGVNVTALVAGLGLTGFALGFALKDIVSNSLSGILIIIYRPITRGDIIKVSSFEGEVVDMDLRYTILDTEEKKVFVPNSMLFNNAVIVSKRPSETPKWKTADR